MHTFSLSAPATSSAAVSATTSVNASSPAFELSSVAFFGRSLAEYAQFFALDFAAVKLETASAVPLPSEPASSSERSGSADALSSHNATPAHTASSQSLEQPQSFRYVSDPAFRDGSNESSCGYFLKPTTTILDVAAGPSAFTAKANRLGLRATAVDPLYGCSPDALATHVQLDYARTIGQMHAKPGNFRFKSFASIGDAERDRCSAAQTFLADYEAGFLDNRYVGGALPNLPFADVSFDVVLCAHLLFIYERLFDYDFHLAACRELVRVSRDEVQIHPVCGPDGKPYRHIARLCADLAADGIASEVVNVDYEFFNGSDTTLVLKRTRCI